MKRLLIVLLIVLPGSTATAQEPGISRVMPDLNAGTLIVDGEFTFDDLLNAVEAFKKRLLGPTDPPCYDNINRYVVCRNGTVTDQLTGLVWLQTANCLPQTTWADAQRAAAALRDGACGLTDGSVPGDWRLATVTEWRATIFPAQLLGCTAAGAHGPPPLTNDAGTRCFVDDPASFFGVENVAYWSGSTDPSLVGGAFSIAWYGDFGFGDINSDFKTRRMRVWPVRVSARCAPGSVITACYPQ